MIVCVCVCVVNGLSFLHAYSYAAFILLPPPPRPLYCCHAAPSYSTQLFALCCISHLPFAVFAIQPFSAHCLFSDEQ